MIPFRDVGRETRELEPELRRAIDDVLRESRFVGGERIAQFERDFARFCGARHTIGVGSGTAAIAIALGAAGIGAGDEVVTAANTCVATVIGIAAAGASPVLADVNPRTLTLDPDAARAAIGPRTRAVVPVHLYGRRADESLLRMDGLRVVEDAAQAHGIAVAADIAAFSFYPTKNLGALGDAGAVVTSDDGAAERARRLRDDRSGQTRLDTLQAAVLSVKLGHVGRWNARRKELAGSYDDALGDAPVELLAQSPDHVHHLYVVRSRDRDGLRARLLERGVETAVHYSRPVHRLSGWTHLDRPGALGESERAAAEVLSLPLYPQLTDDEADTVIEAVRAG